MFTWSTAAPAISATFLASLVEVVEAFTIVLAVATLRGWRPAALGTAAALGVLGAIVLILGPLLDRVPLHLLQLVAGILLLLRSEEHTSELQSLMRISYAVFCLKKKKKNKYK